MNSSSGSQLCLDASLHQKMRHSGKELSSDRNELGVHHALEGKSWWHYDESEVGVHNNRASIWGLVGP